MELQDLVDALRGKVKDVSQGIRDLPDTTPEDLAQRLRARPVFDPNDKETENMASGFAGGGIGMIGGTRMFPEELKQLALAYKLRKGGESAQAQSQATKGWYVGPEGAPKKELSDAGMRLEPFAERELRRGVNDSSVSELIHHPELFKRAPELAELKVSGEINPYANSEAFFHPGDKRIHVVSPDSKSWMQHASHELQHGVQALEGFDLGANYKTIRAALAERNPKASAEEINRAAMDLYKRSMGETEARAVESRFKSGDWSGNPLESYDLPIAKLLRSHTLPR
jgi:hypothetical protein